MKYRSRRETIRLLNRLSGSMYTLFPTRTRKEWLDKRRSCIGASDCAAILGKSPWKSARDVYFDKRGDPKPDTMSDSMMVGMMSEARIRELFSIETKKDVVDCTGMLMVSNAVCIMSCTLDAIVLEDNRRPTILEIKSMSSMTGWEGDTIPEYYLIQILHQMFVTGFRKAILLARFRCSEDMSFPGREKIYTINREDYESTICSIAEKMNEFWNKHIIAGVPPNAVLPEV